EKQKTSALDERLNNRANGLPQLSSDWLAEIKLPAVAPISFQFSDNTAWQLSVLGRMLYSCLVDADFLDTDAFYRRIEKHSARDLTYPSIDELKNRFDAYMAQPKFQSDKGINKTRKQILTTVREHAGLAPGLFTLNVPTGGGKTLSSLAFALDHAKKH